MSAIKDLTGLVFGRLTVLYRSGSNKWGRSLFLCRCECGQEKEIRGGDLINGRTRSCGCLALAALMDRNVIHGMTHTPEFRIWADMHKRCKNIKSPNYGSRSIAVCARWNDFENFCSDMGSRPGPEYTIERVDNDEGYSPQNCKWATQAEQRRNQRRNVKLTAFGLTMVQEDWAKKLRISHNTIKKYRDRGKSMEWIVQRFCGVVTCPLP